MSAPSRLNGISIGDFCTSCFFPFRTQSDIFCGQLLGFLWNCAYYSQVNGVLSYGSISRSLSKTLPNKCNWNGGV